ncbi:ribosomal protein S18 acetylase RimI-like enzyme [Haloactinopolyspora alba]|uniref:Ribosomal protein S18 acetylase RimI-like enzyme n=1 Tax=Haloactinopolyspora alba TaxID=648780 RepID=A0A2P8DWN5_9ACTN|nr:GNAT family N-acetyltransferase [Haloactinopolyspora alba]PSL01614.1 ribosomal protein S18 acetylase RimI-like enzyme [Haloactinopolyspora alba]
MSNVRAATEADIGELVRLRVVFAEAMGGSFNPPSADSRWRDNCAAVLAGQLAAETMRILVVDGTSGLAACGYGTIEQWVPGPHLPHGRIGHVMGVVTDPEHRRLGHARTIMDGLLEWFREQRIPRVDLHASADGEPLYRKLGFTEHPDLSMSWRT